MQFSKDDLQKHIDFLVQRLNQYENYYRESNSKTNRVNYSYDFTRIYNEVKSYIVSDDSLDYTFFGGEEAPQVKGERWSEMKTTEKFFIDDIGGLIHKLTKMMNIAE